MKEVTHNDLTENLIKETDMQLPSSRREIEEDMLEQICLIANAGAEITVEELCSRMDMSRREVNFYLKQLKVHGYIIREKVTSTGHQKDGSGSGISLTEFGKITGEEFQYRHEILTQFLQFQMKKPKRMPAVWNMWSVRKRFSRFVILWIMEIHLNGF